MQNWYGSQDKSGQLHIDQFELEFLDAASEQSI